MAKDQFGFNIEQENNDPTFLSRNLHALAAQLGISAGSIALGYPFFADARRPEYSYIVKELERTASNMGVSISSLDTTKNPFQSLIDPMKGSYYDPRNKHIQMAQRGKNINPGTLAHELGHAKQNPNSFLSKTASTSRFLNMTGLTTLPLVLTEDEDAAKFLAATGTYMAAPNFVHEMDASIKGRKVLLDAAKKSGNKLGFIRSLGPFKGLPTYALALAAPYIMYKYLKSQGQYKKSKEN